MTPTEALDKTFTSNDRDERLTYREYFRCLLTTLYDEGEGFSGKRPFGNSGWDYGLTIGLVEIGAVTGDYEVGPDDENEANKFIFAMIDALCAK